MILTEQQRLTVLKALEDADYDWCKTHRIICNKFGLVRSMDDQSPYVEAISIMKRGGVEDVAVS